MSDDFCHQCFGRGTVVIDGQRVTCACRLRRVACVRCGDVDGPWGQRDDGLVCEGCIAAEAAA